MTVGLSDYIHIFAKVVRPSGVERPADVLKIKIIDVHAEFGTFAVTDVIYAGLLLVDAIVRLNAAEHGIRKASWVISHLTRFLYITENELLAAYEKDFSRDLGHWRERENV